MKVFRFLLVGLLAVSLSACAGSGHRLPAVSDADLYGVKKEASGRKTVFTTHNRSDAQYRKLVNKISNRLLSRIRPLCDHTGYPSCFFQVLYSRADTVNAYAYEHNKIMVFRGLLEFLDSEDEMAAVIAHEMGHHLAHHNKEKQQNAAMGGLVAGLLTAAVLGAAGGDSYNAAQQYQDQQTVKDMMGAGSAVGALSYSREEEGEADLLAQYLLARSGYDLKKAERVLWFLMTMNASAGDTRDRAAFGESHPAGPERIAAWRRGMAEVRANKSKLPYRVEKR